MPPSRKWCWGPDVTVHITIGQKRPRRRRSFRTQLLNGERAPTNQLTCLLVGIGLLPEIIATEVERRLGFHRAVAVDLDLTSQPHLILVADARQHRGQLEALEPALGAEVLHTLLDQYLARA